MISQVTWTCDWLNWLIFECQGDTFDTISLQWENKQVEYDIHCPCSCLAPLQPQDLSLQFLYPSLQGQGQLTWRSAANVNLPSLRIYLAPCPVLLRSTGSCTQLQCSAGECRLRMQLWLCHGSFPLPCTEHEIVESAAFFMALSSPVLSLAQQTCMLLRGSQPTEMGKFLWVKLSLKPRILPAEDRQHLCLLWCQNSLGPCPHAEEM